MGPFDGLTADTGVWPPMNCSGSGQKPKEAE